MRLVTLSLALVASASSPSLAQTTAPPPPPTPAPPGAAPAATAPATPATPAPPPPAAPPSGATSAPAAAPAAAPEPAPEAPPPPPAAPTDPVAIELLDTLQNVCVPAVQGGNLASLTKTAGYRKSGDNYVYKGKGFQLTVESQGSNPSQCHVDILHPADPAAPAQTMVLALHNWAAIDRDYNLYRNDKNVDGATEYTTRSWEHTADGKHQALVITTMRRADGTPAKGNMDTTQMIFSEIPAT